jgi:hypothetical protein
MEPVRQSATRGAHFLVVSCQLPFPLQLEQAVVIQLPEYTQRRKAAFRDVLNQCVNVRAGHDVWMAECVTNHSQHVVDKACDRLVALRSR